MSTEYLAQGLADLVLLAGGGSDGVRTSFAKVITSDATGVMVLMDSMDTGSIGPLQLVCGKALVDARVLCLYLPDNGVWVVIGR